MLDLLIYRQEAKIAPDSGPIDYMVCGKSCLAGDIFGSSASRARSKSATASRSRTRPATPW